MNGRMPISRVELILQAIQGSRQVPTAGDEEDLSVCHSM